MGEAAQSYVKLWGVSPTKTAFKRSDTTEWICGNIPPPAGGPDGPQRRKKKVEIRRVFIFLGEAYCIQGKVKGTPQDGQGKGKGRQEQGCKPPGDI